MLGLPMKISFDLLQSNYTLCSFFLLFRCTCSIHLKLTEIECRTGIKAKRKLEKNVKVNDKKIKSLKVSQQHNQHTVVGGKKFGYLQLFAYFLLCIQEMQECVHTLDHIYMSECEVACVWVYYTIKRLSIVIAVAWFRAAALLSR